MITIERDGKYQISYTTSAGESSAFRCLPEAADLFEVSADLLAVAKEYTADGECYCLNPEESLGRNPCPHCRMLALISRAEGKKCNDQK